MASKALYQTIVEKSIWIATILFGVTTPFGLSAQATTADYREAAIQPHPIDRPTWRRTIAGLDYSSGPEEETAPEETQARSPQPKQENGGSNSLLNRDWGLDSGLLRIIGKVLLIGGAAALLFLLLRSLLSLEWTPRNKKIKEKASTLIDLEEVEHNIEAFDLEDLIQQALAAGQYALALRLYYVSVLKELSRSQLIRWRKGKTNRDYLREMRGSPLTVEFHQLTRVFEQVWYGQHSFAEEDYRRLAPRFQQFVNQVRAQQPPSIGAGQ